MEEKEKVNSNYRRGSQSEETSSSSHYTETAMEMWGSWRRLGIRYGDATVGVMARRGDGVVQNPVDRY